MSMQTNQSSSAASEYNEYGGAEGYDTAEYDSGEYYSEDYGEGEYYADDGYQNNPPPPPPPPPARNAPKKKKKKTAGKGVKKSAKPKKGIKAKKGKAKKGKKVKKGKTAKGKRPPSARTPPPPPPAYQEYYEEEVDQTYTETYPQDEYFPIQDQAVVIEDQAMIETVVEAEEDIPRRKSYQRLTDDPIYSIEEKIDRMLMGKELSLAERFQRKFGEELVMDDSGPLTGYTRREIETAEAVADEDEKGEEKGKGPVPKKKEEKSKKDKKGEEEKPKKDKKGKEEKPKKDKKKSEKAAKKAGRFGGFMKFGGGKPKAKKGVSVAELMGKTAAASKPKSKKVSDIVKKTEPEPGIEVADDTGMDFEEFSNFKTVVDDLLEDLPEDILDSFMATDEFNVYEHVGTADDFTDDDNEYIKIVDDLLEKLPENIVNEFMESDDFELYQKVVEWGSE